MEVRHRERRKHGDRGIPVRAWELVRQVESENTWSDTYVYQQEVIRQLRSGTARGSGAIHGDCVRRTSRTERQGRGLPSAGDVGDYRPYSFPGHAEPALPEKIHLVRLQPLSGKVERWCERAQCDVAAVNEV